MDSTSAPTLGSFYDSRPSDERMVGCYLWPHRFLATPDWNDPVSALKMRWTVSGAKHDVRVSVNGGLFVRIPDRFGDWIHGDPEADADLRARMAFEEEVADECNLVICELATWGIVSEPAAPVYIASAVVFDDHALITSSGGGRENYAERSMGWSTRLVTGHWRIGTTGLNPPDDAFALAARAHYIRHLGTHAPTLVSAAYSAVSRGQPAEALILSWIIVEQYLDDLWSAYVDGRPPSTKAALRDSRTYTAAVQSEVLNSCGSLPDEHRELFDRVRSARNKLAHRGAVSREGSRDAAAALRVVLSAVCKTQVEPLLDNSGIDW